MKSGEGAVTVLDPNFKDYFFVKSEGPSETLESIRGLAAEKRGTTVRAESVELVEKKLLGEEVKVVKVSVRNPRDINPLSEEIRDLPNVDKIFEHDIPTARRYLIDHELTPMEGVKVEGQIKEGRSGKELILTKPPEPVGDVEENLKIMCFDIETYCRGGAPKSERDPVIMLSIADNTGFRKVITWKDFESEHDYVEVVPDEKSLLERFVRVVRERDFDIIMGYNTDLFDFPYIRERADQLGVELKLGRNNNKINSQRRRFETVTRVPGRPHIDVYALVDFLAKIGAIKLISYTLENVYEHMFGESKPDFEGDEISIAWDEGGVRGRKLVEYSMSDADGALELGLEFLPLVKELSRRVKQSLFDVSRMTSGQLVEWLLVSQANKVGEMAPPRPRGGEYQRRRRGSYIGGYVKEPEKGLHEDLVVFDFRSLYPTIVVAHNIDPATLDGATCESGEKVKAPNLPYEFCQGERGFIPETLEGIVKDRIGLKEEMKLLDEDTSQYKSLYNNQWALKIIANSFYGMFGYARARWYSRECAESITSFGRYYIKETIDLADDEGFEVVYGDTDSLFCKVGDKSREEIEEFLVEVNENMPGIMELELEGFYKRGVFITKKRYAMVDEAGKMEVKGLEFVRRDWAKIAKETQERVLRAILNEGSPEKAADIVNEVTKGVYQGEVDLGDLVIHTQLKKNIGEYKAEGPHVAAARRLRVEGEKVEPGMLIGYIVAKGSGSISDRAIPVSQFSKRDYSAEYYISNQILPAVMRVMEVVGYSEEDLRYEETKQTRLGSFGR